MSNPRVRAGLRAESADAVLLYTIGLSIPKVDRHDLQVLLETFHVSIQEIQALCKEADHNAQRYLTLNEDGSGQRYKSAILVGHALGGALRLARTGLARRGGCAEPLHESGTTRMGIQPACRLHTLAWRHSPWAPAIV